MASPMRKPEAAPNTASLLAVRDLQAWYGESHILHGVSFDVAPGEVVTLLGRNGAGKTTTLKSVMGVVPRRDGSIVYEGRETVRLASNRIAHLGIAWCPEERGIFSSLNVEENLLLPPKVRDGGLSVEKIYALFPNLAERRKSQGTKLSGGEQQMLAIGRALMGGPEVLLLDEPSLGLAPKVVAQVFEVLQTLNAAGLTILLVEQKARRALDIAHEGYVMERGQIVFSGPSAALKSEPRIVQHYLGGAGVVL